jgi:Flp pilus assembly protein TadG
VVGQFADCPWCFIRRLILKLIKGKKGQSMVEFALILPVFMLLVLGIAQLSLIFINKMMLQYSAYMLARVAVAYADDIDNRLIDSRTSIARNVQLQKADSILKSMMSTINNPSGSALKTLSCMGADSLQKFFLGKFKGADVSWQWDNSIKSSDGRFLRVNVSYDMPLKVPFVNKIFNGFQKNQSSSADYATAESGFPVYTISAYSIMRYNPGIF